MHPHKEIICDWANKYLIGIWYRKKDEKEWKLLSPESLLGWYEDCIYVLDDEWAKLKKAFYDGKIIQYKTIKNNWVDIETPTWTLSIKTYRIKPDNFKYSLEEFLKDNYINWDLFLINCKIINQRWNDIDDYYSDIKDLIKNQPEHWLYCTFNYTYANQLNGRQWEELALKWENLVVSKKYENITFTEIKE